MKLSSTRIQSYVSVHQILDQYTFYKHNIKEKHFIVSTRV